MEFVHEPVLLEEVLTNLVTDRSGIYVDGTLGGAGHSVQLWKRLNGGRIIGIDRDAEAITAATARAQREGCPLTAVKDNFCNIKQILARLGIEKVNGILLDLGVSSYQLDNPQRGFSYMQDAPLDMKMDQSQFLSAYEVVNEYSEWELYRVIKDYGEENWARRIAQFIVQRREKGRIETTGQLVGVINAAIPAAARRSGGHPAKRTFQAIRIAVNDELGAVSEMIRDAPDRLSEHGRLCVITFHSLEDRIIKQGIALKENGCTCPRELPICVCGFRQTLRSVTRKPVLPSEKELLENPRSRSAKLRVAEKTGEQ